MSIHWPLIIESHCCIYIFTSLTRRRIQMKIRAKFLCGQALFGTAIAVADGGYPDRYGMGSKSSSAVASRCRGSLQCMSRLAYKTAVSILPANRYILYHPGQPSARAAYARSWWCDLLSLDSKAEQLIWALQLPLTAWILRRKFSEIWSKRRSNCSPARPPLPVLLLSLR